MIIRRLFVCLCREVTDQIFDLGDDYYSGYFSDTEITDIKDQYIGSVIDLDAADQNFQTA